MAVERIAKHTMYYTADKERLVAEDSPEAAFLFVRAGSPIPAAEAERLGYTAADEAQVYDARADHLAKHGGETQRQADAARERMFAGSEARGGEDPDGPTAAGERGEKAAAPQGSKAVERAPANKAK